MDNQTALAVLADSECIYTKAEIDLVVQRMADEINAKFGQEADLLVLCVMKGGLFFAGQLLPLIKCPLEFDYLHVTRYGDKTGGGKLSWRSAPWLSMKDRTVLIVDDILDEGITLAAIYQRLLQMGARAVHSAVFADKQLGKSKPISADFVGVSVENRYIFGFGMDIREAWRHLPALYAYRGAAT